MDPALWEELRAGDDRMIEAIIRLVRPGMDVPGVRIVSRFGTIATCRIPAADVITVRARPEVLSLKAARGVSPGWRETDEPPAEPRRLPGDERRGPSLAPTGAGVVVAAVDFGLDFDCAAFRTASGDTRLLSFWDQRDQASGGPVSSYGYGVEHDREAIDSALHDPDPYKALGYHPAVADPRGRGAHGTRVLDIAAGNGRAGGPAGLASEADLVFVHLADRRTGGVGSFGDSVRLLEAVDFATRTAGAKPCVVNISAGRICGPKDGTTLVEQAFDQLLGARQGTFVVDSGGNYYRWRAHSCGVLRQGERRTLTFVVDPTDVTPTELEIWYDGRDEFAVRIDPPGHITARAVRLGEQAELLADGQMAGRLYHRACDSNNGDHHIEAYLSTPGQAGEWTVTLEGRRVTHGRFHAFIERDDSCPSCQARFSARDARRRTTLGSIATSHLPLVVGAYDGFRPGRPPAGFTSAGPCRDGRSKPDLVGPGVGVLAARSAPAGATGSTGLLVRGNGTSFAAPHVAGAVALCYQLGGARLTADDIRALVLGSCDPPPTADRGRRLGRGYLNVDALIADTVRFVTAPRTSEEEPPATPRHRDVVVMIREIGKPGDVADHWRAQARPDWAHPLSALERGYVEAFTDLRTPASLRMRGPVDPARLTADERGEANRWFGGDAQRYAAYETRRRIVANYVFAHPATIQLELGLYRLVRDVDPMHFAFERGWQLGRGREMFTADDVSELGAAGEFLLALTVVWGLGRVLSAVRPPAGSSRSAGALTDPVWDLPPEGGVRINGRWYTEHALERMAPDTPPVRARLRTRVGQRLLRLGIGPGHPAYDRVLSRALAGLDPRGVPPSVVEAEIARAGSTNVRVVTADRGRVVVTVIRR
ncbi:S8 family serine peptidase [Actinoplanes sp. LDG1-06]|uniref:S8 family serine peptidase n=1 Tax=Paractinoplanes ovalisporus TaxID=2810368 RepID=A0ABS2ALX3_9ACTN|nr:S8 family serine peptidase [Actinoplanes ovalisporus]MBM2620815.1 S8 family serine peptidase [Actinoplanes ovalisporus]